MEPKVNYTVVGLFVIVLTLALGLAIFWFSAAQHQENRTYLIYMNEAVTGLNKQAPVKFNGVDMGYVSNIRLNPKNPQQVLLELSIPASAPINQSTRATLMMQGITGTTYIGLIATAPNAPPIKILPGEKYPIIPARASILYQLNAVADNIKELSGILHSVLSPKNSQAITQTLENVAKITQTFADNSGNIDKSLKNASLTLSQTRLSSESLSQQTMPNMSEAFLRLNQILNNVQQLTNSLKNNPAVLIRGKTSQPLGPGEK